MFCVPSLPGRQTEALYTWAMLIRAKLLLQIYEDAAIRLDFCKTDSQPMNLKFTGAI